MPRNTGQPVKEWFISIRENAELKAFHLLNVKNCGDLLTLAEDVRIILSGSGPEHWRE
jgi:hypothetical protein